LHIGQEKSEKKSDTSACFVLNLGVLSKLFLHAAHDTHSISPKSSTMYGLVISVGSHHHTNKDSTVQE